MYLFVGIARPGHILLPVSSGTHRVHAGHEVAVLAQHVDRTGVPMRVMIRMLTTT
jgi:hypothetical protein